jgi:hypothetical protein
VNLSKTGRYVLSLTLAALIVLAASLFYVEALTGGGTHTISGGVYPGAACLTVWTDGTYCYLKDNYGNLLSAATSTDASVTLNYALTDLPSSGGEIKVDAGFYTAYNSINVSGNYVTFMGEGKGGAAQANFNNTVLALANGVNQNLFDVSGIQDDFKDIVLDGNCQGQTLPCSTVFLQGTAGVGTHDFFFDTTITNGTTYDVWSNSTDVVVFQDCEINYAGTYGLYGYYAIQNMLYATHVRSNGWAVSTGAGVAWDGVCWGSGLQGCFVDYNKAYIGGNYYGYGVKEIGSSSANMIYIGNQGIGDPQGLFAHLTSSYLTFRENTYKSTLLSGEPPTGTYEQRGSWYGSSPITVTLALCGSPSSSNTFVEVTVYSGTAAYASYTISGETLTIYPSTSPIGGSYEADYIP